MPPTQSRAEVKTVTQALVPLPKTADDPALSDPRLGDVDEWGRSEHMRELARRLYDPVYRHWFRVDWEGLEKIPKEGGALIVANHAGAIPSDAPAIMHGIETELQRPVYGLAEYIFKRRRSSARCGRASAESRRSRTTRTGCCASSGSWCSCSQRAPRAPRRTTPSVTGCGVSAAAASSRSPCERECPIVPIAVVGAEESMPILFKLPRLAKSLGVPYVPVTANMLAFGPLGLVGYFPVQVQVPGARPDPLRRRRPTSLATRAARSWTSPRASGRRSRTRSTTCCASAARSGSADLGSTGPRHRPRHVLGRPRRAGARAGRDDVDVIVGLDREEPIVELATHRVRAQRRELLDPRSHREGHEGRHDRAHLPRRRLHADALADDARDQRHRHDEPVRGGVRAGQHGAQRDREVLDARLRQQRAGPDVVQRGDASELVAGHTGRAQPARPSRATCATSRRTTRTSTSRCCGSRTCSALTSSRRCRRRSSCRWCRRCSASTHGSSSCTRTTSSARSCSCSTTTCPASTTSPATDCCRGREVAAICGKRTLAAPSVRRGPVRRAAAPLRCRPAARAARRCSSTGAASTTAGFKRAGFNYQYTSAGTVQAFVEALRLRSTVGDHTPRTGTSADVEQFFRHSPAVVREHEDHDAAFTGTQADWPRLVVLRRSHRKKGSP